MNKLIVKDSKIKINEQIINLDIEVNNLTLIVYGNCIINDINNNEDLTLNIKLMDNSHLLYNRFNKDISNFKLNIDINNNNYLEFNYSLLEQIPCKLTCNANIMGSNNNVSINVYGVTKDRGSIATCAVGDVIKDIVDNEFLENIRIMTLNNEDNVIIPNLLVSSNEVSVNHNAVISSVPQDYLFYLNSKGICEDKAKDLIIRGFLTNNLKINEKEMINIE